MERKDQGHSGARPRRRPNFFVSVQITNPQIKERMEHVQKYITAQEPLFEDATVEVATAHLTLMVLHITESDHDKEMASAKAALESCGKKLQQFVNHPVHLDVAGLGNFGDKVVFAKLKEGDALDNLKHIAQKVRICFSKEGLPSTESREFAAHLTIMKMSNAPDLYSKGIRRIPAQLYQKYSGATYGRQTVLGLQLCAMGDRDETGYYSIAHSVPLVPLGYTDGDGEAAKATTDSKQDFDFSLPAGSGP